MIHDYKHLGKYSQDNVNITLTMEELAEKVCRANYGLHRFISEVIDINRARDSSKHREFADDLEKALNKLYNY